MTTTTPNDIAQFLLARICEDEAAARAASDGVWTFRADRELPGIGNITGLDADGNGITAVAQDNDREAGYGAVELEDADHITRWQPARVLAECAAKRRIVEDIVSNDYITPAGSSSETDGLAPRVLAHLALPYADHPDYDESWAVA